MIEKKTNIGTITETFKITDDEFKETLINVMKELEKSLMVISDDTRLKTSLNIIPTLESVLKGKTKRDKINILTGLLVQREFDRLYNHVKEVHSAID